jgi:two-component system sensor histidine kinase EvgS
VGISKENQKKLFIDFGRLAETESVNRSGTGLGLSICKQIVEKMGGSVHVESDIGEGASFCITIKTMYRSVNETMVLPSKIFIQKASEDIKITSPIAFDKLAKAQ